MKMKQIKAEKDLLAIEYFTQSKIDEIKMIDKLYPETEYIYLHFFFKNGECKKHVIHLGERHKDKNSFIKRIHSMTCYPEKYGSWTYSLRDGIEDMRIYPLINVTDINEAKSLFCVS